MALDLPDIYTAVQAAAYETLQQQNAAIEYGTDPGVWPTVEAALNANWTIVANAVADAVNTALTEIITNAEVNVTVASVTGIATGSEESGPGTGTGTIS